MDTEKQTAMQEELQVLTFKLENVSYGVDVRQVREVKNFEGVTPLPYAPSYVRGLTNLRDEVVPVVDLCKRLGFEKEGSDNTGIMIILQGQHPMGVMVDSVMEVLTLHKKDIEENAQSLIAIKIDAVLGVAKQGKDLIIILDLIRVVSSQDKKQNT